MIAQTPEPRDLSTISDFCRLFVCLFFWDYCLLVCRRGSNCSRRAHVPGKVECLEPAFGEYRGREQLFHGRWTWLGPWGFLRIGSTESPDIGHKQKGQRTRGSFSNKHPDDSLLSNRLGCNHSLGFCNLPRIWLSLQIWYNPITHYTTRMVYPISIKGYADVLLMDSICNNT